MKILSAARRPDGTVPVAVVDQVAADLQVSTRQVRRWQAKAVQDDAAGEAVFGDPADPDATVSPFGAVRMVGAGSLRGYVPTSRHLEVIAGCRTKKAAWQAIRNEPGVPDYRGFLLACARLDRALHSMVAGDGRDGLVRQRIYAPQIVERRNQRWELDEQELPMRVLPHRGTRAIHPRKTTIIDASTRAVMASILHERPANSSIIAALIAKAIKGRNYVDPKTGEIIFLGGVPDEIVWDNAACNLSEHVTAVALALRFIGTAVNPFAGYEKGKIERFQQTEQRELYDTLPGATHGPKSFSGMQYWNSSDTELLSMDMTRSLAEEWEDRYNLGRPHSALAGATPLEAWAAQTGPLRVVQPEQLHDAMLKPAREHTVNKSGIRFENHDYLAPELNSYVGRKVEIRYLPHLRAEDRYLEVFFGGEWLCTAIPAENLDAQMRRDILTARRRQYKEATTRAKQGAQMRQESTEEALAARMEAETARREAEKQAAKTAAAEARAAARADAKAERAADEQEAQQEPAAPSAPAAPEEAVPGDQGDQADEDGTPWAAPTTVRTLPTDLPPLGRINPTLADANRTPAQQLLALLEKTNAAAGAPDEPADPTESTP